jgi:hypothetical protein
MSLAYSGNIAHVVTTAIRQRTRERTNYLETYERLFSRVHEGLDAAARSDRPIRHLILLFGIPLAYPVGLITTSHSGIISDHSLAPHLA